MKNCRLLLANCFIVFHFVSAFSQSTQEDPSKSQPQPNTLSINRILAPNKTSDESNREIEELRFRLEELENRNRILTEALTDLKTKVDLLGHSEALSNTAESAKPDQGTPMTSAPPSGQVDKDPPVRWSELLGEGNRLKFYGFLRLDLDLDSQRPNNSQIPLFITSQDPGLAVPTE